MYKVDPIRSSGHKVKEYLTKDEGLDNTEIAKRMERSLGTVYLKLKDHGLTQPTGHRYILMKAGLLEEGK